jgi:hypothetical protein
MNFGLALLRVSLQPIVPSLPGMPSSPIRNGKDLDHAHRIIGVHVTPQRITHRRCRPIHVGSLVMGPPPMIVGMRAILPRDGRRFHALGETAT